MVDYQNYEFDEERYRKALESAIEQKYDEIKKELEQKLVITVMGIVNAGKSTLINQLLDEQWASTSLVPGWTKEVHVRNLSKNVVITDTPGLSDVDESVANKTLEHLNLSDIVLYLFPSHPGITKPQLDSFNEVKAKQRPTMAIFNVFYRESLSPDEIDQIIGKAKSTLNYYEPFVDISAKSGYNVDKVDKWIKETLRKHGKELLWEKVTRRKDEAVDELVLEAAIAAAAIGALPIPGSDIVPLTALQAALILKIANIYGYDISREKAKALASSLIAGQIGRTVFRELGKLFPGVGSVIGASVAGAFTYALGMAMKEYFKSGMDLPLDELPDMIKRYSIEAKKYKSLFGKSQS